VNKATNATELLVGLFKTARRWVDSLKWILQKLNKLNWQIKIALLWWALWEGNTVGR
jgi:hypothetical protein